jgi:hypothetical protein
MSPAAIRGVFERFGVREPTDGGVEYVHLSPSGSARVVEFSADTGRPLEYTNAGAYTPEPGLYLPLARLVAGLEVAETLLTDDDTCPDMQSTTYRALTTYRSTR